MIYSTFYNNKKILKNYLWFSIGFSIYGFSRGYRGLESHIEYKERKKYFQKIKYLENRRNELDFESFKEISNNVHDAIFYVDKYIELKKEIIHIENKINSYNRVIQHDINLKKKKILITQKIWHGFREIQPFYYPIFNLISLFNILQRISIWYNIKIEDYDKYNNVFCFWYSDNCICYDII